MIALYDINYTYLKKSLINKLMNGLKNYILYNKMQAKNVQLIRKVSAVSQNSHQTPSQQNTSQQNTSRLVRKNSSVALSQQKNCGETYINKVELLNLLDKQSDDIINKIEGIVKDTLDKPELSGKIESIVKDIIHNPEISMPSSQEITKIYEECIYYKEKYDKICESRYQDYKEFAKIIADYQKIIATLCSESHKIQNEDTIKSLKNIAILKRTSSATIDTEKYRVPNIYK